MFIICFLFNIKIYVYFSSKYPRKEANTDFDEQRKIAEGADALLNLAGVTTPLNHGRAHHIQSINSTPKSESSSKLKKRSASNDYSNISEKRRKHWPKWSEGKRYLKQII